MKIAIVTYGSRGDVQPLIALALALQKRGAQVLLSGPPEHAPWAASYGVPYAPLGTHFKSFAEKLPDSYTFRAIVEMTQFLRAETRLHFQQLPRIISSVDVVIGASLAFALPSVAEAAGVPYRFAAFCPQVLPSKCHPPIVFKSQNFPFWINRLCWLMMELLDAPNGKPIINAERRKLGLAPIDSLWRHVIGNPVIIATDPLLGAPPEDVKQKYAQPGYFHLPSNGELHKDLLAFLDDGPPPIYIGFGSMPCGKNGALGRIIQEAVSRSSHRYVVSRGWGGLELPRRPQNVFMVEETPHDILFPRLAAVIHHGGSGATATAARAGVPQLVVPHAVDQFYWGRRVADLGLGPPPLPRSKLSAERLLRAVDALTRNKKYAQNAWKTGLLLRRCHDPDRSARMVEESFRRDRVSRV